MSKKKEYRVETEVTGSVSLYVSAKDEEEAMQLAEAAIEGGEANIDWREEGHGTITLNMPGTHSGSKMRVFEEE
jgi:hypothetical protein